MARDETTQRLKERHSGVDVMKNRCMYEAIVRFWVLTMWTANVRCVQSARQSLGRSGRQGVVGGGDGDGGRSLLH